MIKLEWSNTCDLGGMLYQNNFMQKIYIDSEIANPDYDIREEGISDGEKNFRPTFSYFGKIYKFEFVATEFVSDALTQIPLHSYVRITEDDSYAIAKDVIIEVEWYDYFNKITVSFIADRWIDIETSLR